MQCSWVALHCRFPPIACTGPHLKMKQALNTGLINNLDCMDLSTLSLIPSSKPHPILFLLRPNVDPTYIIMWLLVWHAMLSIFETADSTKSQSGEKGVQFSWNVVYKLLDWLLDFNWWSLECVKWFLFVQMNLLRDTTSCQELMSDWL